MKGGVEQVEILIVGGGPAAQAAAASYREAGGSGRLAIVAGEDELPYQRPPLTKDFLRGESERAELPLTGEWWYRKHQIELARGARIASIDLERSEAKAEDGRAWRFERCLLATGARPLIPDLPGISSPGVQTIRTIPDSERLAALAGAPVAVVGSGFIGCEAAASLAMLEAEVTLATMEAAPQLERLGEEVAARIADQLEGYGVELRSGARLSEIAEVGDGTAARFEHGPEERAAAILLALGVERNDELAGAAGLAIEDGVPVDAAMVSSDPRLLAAGDVSFAFNPAAGRRLRVEHWGEALNQGEVAGRTMAGETASWETVPGFWSTIGEQTLKYAGWGDGWDQVRFESGPGQAFLARYGREGRLVGVLAHQRDEAYEEGSDLIAEGAAWS